jgi:hypothetical protein
MNMNPLRGPFCPGDLQKVRTCGGANEMKVKLDLTHRHIFITKNKALNPYHLEEIELAKFVNCLFLCTEKPT